MRRYNSKFLSTFHSLLPSKSSVSDETNSKKPSARERLDGLASLRIHFSAIELTGSETLGSGGKGEVVRVKYKPNKGSGERVVAMKKLSDHEGSEKKKFFNEYVHEVEMMAKLSHENIIQLIGFVEDLENGQACIIIAWEPNGNLREFLKSGEWAIPERISLIRDTFSGINYLHTRRPPICHGDLKSLNILVSSAYRAIITDFGSAREVNVSKTEFQSQQDRRQGIENPVTEETGSQPQVSATGNQLTLTGPACTLRWASPEIVNGDPPALPSDIWAAGWVCWEVMTNKLPFSDLNAASSITLRVIKGNVPSVYEDSQLEQVICLCSLMTDCWKLGPKDRPSVSECVKEVYSMPSATPYDRRLLDSTERSFSLLMKMGALHCNQANLDNAVPLFKEALRIATDEGDEKAQASALSRLGDVYRIQSKNHEAEETLIQAQEIYTHIGDDVGQAYVLNSLGRLYTAQEKYKEAGELLIKAKNIYIRVGMPVGHAQALLEIGAIYRFHGQLDLAAESYSQARDIFIREGDRRNAAFALMSLGRIQIFGGESKWIDAEENLGQALTIFIRIGYSLGRANTLRSLGHLRREQGRKTEAAAFYAEARDFYHQIGDPDSEGNASFWLAKVSEPEEDLSVAKLVIG